MWETSLESVDGIMFVVDASDQERVSVARDELACPCFSFGSLFRALFRALFRVSLFRALCRAVDCPPPLSPPCGCLLPNEYQGDVVVGH